MLVRGLTPRTTRYDWHGDALVSLDSDGFRPVGNLISAITLQARHTPSHIFAQDSRPSPDQLSSPMVRPDDTNNGAPYIPIA